MSPAEKAHFDTAFRVELYDNIFLALDNLRIVEYLYIYEIVGMAIHVNNIFTSLSNLSIPLRDVLRFPGTAEKAVEIIQD